MTAAPDSRVYTPRAWYLALVAAMGLVAAVALRLLFDVGSVGLLVVVIVPLAARSALKVTTSPAGVSISGREAAWSELTLRRATFSELIETPKTSRGATKRVVVQPNVYEARWREGRLGDDVRRWAPHLLDDTPASGVVQPD